MSESEFSIYKGRAERKSGQMIYRIKGDFASKERARAYQQKMAKMGKKARVIHFIQTDLPWGVEVMAKHNFMGRNYVLDRRK